MKNLTTEKGRRDAIKNIEENFLSELRTNGFDIAEDAVCNVHKNSIELGISAIGNDKKNGYKMAFSSDISLYASDLNSIFGRKENEINFGSSGCFTPKTRESYWRTIHAASILKNWDLSTTIINKHCNMYADLENEIFSLSQK